MSLSEYIFRAYDIRGKYGKDFTEQGMEKIGKAIGSFMKQKSLKSCVIGRDVRKSSEPLSNALKQGLIETGVEVSDAGETPIGVAVFTAKKGRKDVCAYVTASHLPPEWNGLKLFHEDGLAFSEEQIQEIGRKTINKNFVKTEKGVDKGKIDLIDDYIKFNKKNFDCDGVKCVIDCGGGSTHKIVPKVFDSMGMETHTLFCEKDVNFSKRPSKPTEKSLTKLKEKVIEENADFGAGFDGDGDRVLILNEKGGTVSADELAIIIGRKMLENKKGKIIATVESSQLTEDVLRKKGAEIIRVPVGHTHMTKEGKNHNAILGYEPSNHMVQPQISLFDDATLTVMKLAEVLKKEEKTLSELASNIPSYDKEKTFLKCPDKVKFEVLEELKEEIEGKYGKVDLMDGIRVDFDKSWVLTRCSNTSPEIRIAAEAKTETKAKKLLEEFKEKTSKKIEEKT